MPSEALEKPTKERDYFHFKEPLVISQRSWLIGSFTGMGKKTRRSIMAAVIVGTNIVRIWRCERAKSACVMSHEKVDEAANLLVPLKYSKNESKTESTKRQSRLEPY